MTSRGWLGTHTTSCSICQGKQPFSPPVTSMQSSGRFLLCKHRSPLKVGLQLSPGDDLRDRRHGMHRTAAIGEEQMTASLTETSGQEAGKTLLCSSVTAGTVQEAFREIDEAATSGADVVELRLDYLTDFDPEQHLQPLIEYGNVPKIVTLRPEWEGGRYKGAEPYRLTVLKYAAVLGAEYVDVELKVANIFFAGGGEVSPKTKVIVSSHNYEFTPSAEQLRGTIDEAWQTGASIVKIATTASSIVDALTVLSLLKEKKGPTIALAMGERGQISRLLAPRFGGYLTFGALGAGRESAPGQPTLHQLRHLYRLQQQSEATRVFGIVGRPVAHSRSPALHNAAFAAQGFDGVYVPLLVDDFPAFLAASKDLFQGLSVTIPHKEAALAGAGEADPLAREIGAANTLVRGPGGAFTAYNTDCSAAISSIERALGGGPHPLQGKEVVVIGAGGAGRALAFGAAAKGARVAIANRSRQRAEDLAAAIPGGARVLDLDQVGAERADVLANTTSVGMEPHSQDTPVPAAALANFRVVFDAVYTPLETRLLKEAEAAGCVTVSGLEMFIGQAADQFELFTGQPAPLQIMRDVVLQSLQAKH